MNEKVYIYHKNINNIYYTQTQNASHKTTIIIQP